MKFQSKQVYNSFNLFPNPNKKLSSNLIDSILNKRPVNPNKYSNKFNDVVFDRSNNVFQDWFAMNDKAILNLQTNTNNNPLYKDIPKKVFFTFNKPNTASMNNVRKPIKEMKDIKDKQKPFAKSHTNFFPRLISNQRTNRADVNAKGKNNGRNSNHISTAEVPNRNMNFIYSSINSEKESKKDLLEKDLNKLMKNKENFKINLNKRELLMNPPNVNKEVKNSLFNSGTPEIYDNNKKNVIDPSFRKLNQFKTLEERENKNNNTIPFNISNFFTNDKLRDVNFHKENNHISSKNMIDRDSIKKSKKEENVNDNSIENNSFHKEKLNFSFKFASFYDNMNDSTNLKITKKVKVENSEKHDSNIMIENINKTSIHFADKKIIKNEENNPIFDQKEKKVKIEPNEVKINNEAKENKSEYDSTQRNFMFNSNAYRFKTKENDIPEEKKPDISEVLKRVLLNNKREAAVKNREIYSSNPQNYINLERNTNSAKYFIDNSHQRRNFGELKKNSIEFVLKDLVLWKKHEELWINLSNPSFTIGDLEKYIIPPNDFDILLSVYYKNNNITNEKIELNEKLGNFKLEMSKWKDAYKKCLFRWHPDKLFPLLDRLKLKDDNRKANLKKKCGVIVNNINKQLASVLEFLRSFVKNNN